MGAAQHLAPGAVDADRLVADQPRAGKPRQPAEVDVAFVEIVMAGDPARQHARIGGLDIAGDQGHAHPGHRPHAKAFQHMDMGMPAADEHEILGDRDRLPHRLFMPQRRSGKRAGPRSVSRSSFAPWGEPNGS